MLTSRNVALVSALGLLISVATSKEQTNKEWWKTTLVYQIWPRGFRDSDGDGNGDLKGIISQLDYLKDLGIETIWLNSIYHSPLIDAGFDVSNFTDINPLFGTFKDFDNLVQEVHKRGLRIILDFIPNHTSDQHEFFKRSVWKMGQYTDYYVWADGSIDKNGTKIPPNNWMSAYSDTEGSAWTWHDKREQWYYHKFHTTQPDLNLRNENLIGNLMTLINFWLEKKIDGFCINSVAYFFEDKALRNESPAGSGTYTFGLSESTALLYRFRQAIDDWISRKNAESKLLIAESHDTSHKNLMAYYGNSTHKGIPPFNFKFITHIRNNSGAGYVKQILNEWMKLLPRNTLTNWVLSNHENSRAASRIGFNRIDGLHMLCLLLPGQAYTYYGEEIAMLDTKISWAATIDPMGCDRGPEEFEKFSRDPARTPMQWNSGVSAGFSTSNATYLPINSRYVSRNVDVQMTRDKSNLKTYKELADLRKNVVFTDGDYELASLNNDRVLVLKRFLKDHPVYIAAINLDLRSEHVDLTEIYPDVNETLDIVVASSNTIYMEKSVPRNKIILTANAALVLKGEQYKEEPSSSSSTSEATERITTASSSTTEKGRANSTTLGTTPSSTTESETSSFAPVFHLVISAVITVIAVQNVIIE